MQKFKNYQYRQSHAQIALCYAVASATWLPCNLIVILFYCISVTFFCGMCPANLKQLLTLILFLKISVTFFCGMCPANLKQLLTLILYLEILTKLCVSFSLFLYNKLLSNAKSNWN